ncbi:sporulation-specific transcriptional regulator GerR [Bacillus haynesii]|uniref:sporulation-specific transcriptional regulator GerR n=1 Tax=Bacillus haynesii TaxID=1925021 RepID=UPI00227FC9AB|nr:sporulation-specific transcriptional regulator GerR [Bacillus haynesii]MCY7966280.1 sporulation-specific transcriptional regulator GerR [Bacillus haynesii]MCY8399837.1 sporulation-specific transcriptional regulator GerR [Bacillus haynesii]MCY8643780.1 sporulation-specific transcriptional regulator GerR [Bacillus haynesii]MCY9212088.1 sporulation-specific transcriptional regulator GerR [Bacillus haynesii]MEC1576999.1 sporulation-specific transcriptional regulator GerR [Bacillus haynesii]
MTITRQDAWTQDEDILLAEVVLRHIREGGTQLSAFEEVGKALSRTAAACGFRWNSFVRKQYQSGIELAKKQRKELRKKIGIHSANLPGSVKTVSGNNAENLTLDDVIQYLEKLKEVPVQKDFIDEKKKLAEEINELKQEVEKLRSENQSLKKRLELTEEDYKALIEIMERARKMVVLQEDERNKKAKLQPEPNENLEKLEK